MTDTEISNGEPNESPFPTAAEMDLDIWLASSRVSESNNMRIITGVADDEIIYVNGCGPVDRERDETARRIEMIGDLYDALRDLSILAEKSGLNVTSAFEVLAAFVSPKPFPGPDEGAE